MNICVYVFCRKKNTLILSSNLKDLCMAHYCPNPTNLRLKWCFQHESTAFVLKSCYYVTQVGLQPERSKIQFSQAVLIELCKNNILFLKKEWCFKPESINLIGFLCKQYICFTWAPNHVFVGYANEF